MKLVRETSGCNGDYGIKSLRGKHCFRIYGKPEEINLIDQIEDLIGNEVYSQCHVDDVLKVTLWKHKAFDFCAGDRDNGEGCGWIVEMDDVEEFKALWKKHKTVAKDKVILRNKSMSKSNVILVIQYLDSSCLTTIKFKLDNENDKAELINKYGVSEDQIKKALTKGTLQFTTVDYNGLDARYTLINGFDGK